MNEFQSQNPDLFNPYQVINEGDIIPGIKPPLPLESREFYKKIRPSGEDGVARDIKRGIPENVKLREFFTPFVGQIIVDIGPGDTITGYEIALLSSANSYVGVEPYYFTECVIKFTKQNLDSLRKKSARIPHTIVEADALSLLRRLPDRSVSLFASQLEGVMKEEYRIDVEKEIQRVLHPQGAFIGYDSKLSLDRNTFQYDLFDKESSDDAGLYFQLEKYKLKT